MKNTNLVEFEEDIWSTENSVDVLPYILVCKGGLETYIAANDSNTIFVPSQATCICSCAFDAGYHLNVIFRDDDYLGKDFEYPDNIGTDGVEKIVLHKKVDAIEYDAFSGLKNLKVIEVEKGNPYFKGGDVLYATRKNNYAEFIWCSPLKTGDYVVAPWIDYICDHAFEDSMLDSVTFGEDVYFGFEVFKNCPDITIKAPEGSSAIEYAKKNGLKFEEITY